MASKLVVRSYEHPIEEELVINPPHRSWIVQAVEISPHPMWDTKELITVVWRVPYKEELPHPSVPLPKGPF
jgi:hypothetical protein